MAIMAALPRPVVLAALAALAALALCVASASAREPSGVRAGAAAADMTPPVGTPQFAYTARSYVFAPGPEGAGRAIQLVGDPDTAMFAKTFEPSNGIHTRVYARAIVLEQRGERFALAMADLGGLPYAMTQTVLEKIRATGIDGDHLLLSATHTHSSTGPIWPADNSAYGFFGGDAFDPRIFELTAASIARAIVGAVARLAPARVGTATAVVRDASRNREYEVYQRNADVEGLAPEEQRARSIDPTVTVVRVDDIRGRPLAVWSNFAIHGTSFDDGNHLLSGDNMATTERLAEQALRRAAGRRARRGGPAPVNVWTNGAEGDTSPDGDNRTIGGREVDYLPTEAARANQAGRRAAAGVLAAWREAGRSMVTDPGLDARRTLLRFDGRRYGAEGARQEPVGPIPVLGAGVVADRRPSVVGGVQSQDPGAQEPNCAPVDGLAGPGQGLKMPLIGGPGLAPDTFPVSVWRIGRQGIAAFPAEITKQMGQRIRDALVARSAGALDRVAIAGMTSAYVSYTATPEEYDACTYEGSFTLFGRQQGYAWLSTGERLVEALIRGEPVAGSAPEPPDLSVGTGESTPARVTPGAGAALAQPADVARFGRAVFAWRGGDPQVDAPRGRAFVALQRRVPGGWRTVDTEDGVNDITVRSAGDVWTETYQFDACAPPGRYRFRASGRAVIDDGAPPTRYVVASEPFAVAPLRILGADATVAAGVATVRPLYPDPGGAALLALPRLVRGADVSLTLSDGRTVAASEGTGSDGRDPDPQPDGVYSAPVGTATVTAVRVTDACGNSS